MFAYRLMLAVALATLGSAAVPGPVEAATLVVANKSDDTVDLIDPVTGASRATLPTGNAPHEVAVSPDGSTAVISDYGDREQPGSTLTVVDLDARRVQRTIDLGEHRRPHGMRWLRDGRLVVTAEGSGRLLIVDVAEGVVRDAIPTGQRISHMVEVAPDGSRAFVANIGSGTVTVIDLERGAKVGDVVTGEGAEGIAITPDGREVWVGNRAADTVAIVDARTLEVLETIPCSGFPIRIAMTPDGRKALVSLAEAGEVALFDVGERKELHRAALDLGPVADAAARLFGDRFGSSPVPVGIVITGDGAMAWVAATQADAVIGLDVSTLEVEALLRAGREPDGMAWVASTRDGEPRSGDLELLREWMTGSFDSGDQAREADGYLDIRLHMVPIWTGRDDGPWLYVEQAMAGSTDRPYRQRVYRLSRDDDGAFRSAVFEIPEPLRFAGAWSRSDPLAGLTPSDLARRTGCDVVLRWNGSDAFVGGTVERDCASSLRGASYATSEVTLRDGSLESWDRGFDSAGVRVWGAESGAYRFVRRTAGNGEDPGTPDPVAVEQRSPDRGP